MTLTSEHTSRNLHLIHIIIRIARDFVKRKRSQKSFFVIFSAEINNSAFAAYNNDVETITVTERGENRPYISYLYGKVKNKFSFLPAYFELIDGEDRASVVVKTERKYCPYVRKYTEERIAEVIAIGYKYRYFKRTLFVPFLSEAEREILYVALVAADLSEDREFIERKVSGSGEYCIDGTFCFRLSALKERWEKIASCVPREFSSVALESFLDFLVGEGEKKVFLKEGVVYDEAYRPVQRSPLVGKQSEIFEILLCGAGDVYCFGDLNESARNFLKKYYTEKAFFC